MNTKELSLSQTEVHKLLASASGDAALLHLYIKCGNDPKSAGTALGMSGARYSCAAAALRQLGLWPEETQLPRPANAPPQYTETDVLQAMRSTAGTGPDPHHGRVENSPVLPELSGPAGGGSGRAGQLLQRAGTPPGLQPEPLPAHH